MDVVQEENNMHYGLQARVLTTDVKKEFYALDHIQVGLTKYALSSIYD